MNENSKAPTDASTRPLGNSTPQPTPLARGGIGPNARAKMREINPDATRAVREVLARQPGNDGHARG
jgi:hypothetical protein